LSTLSQLDRPILSSLSFRSVHHVASAWHDRTRPLSVTLLPNWVANTNHEKVLLAQLSGDELVLREERRTSVVDAQPQGSLAFLGLIAGSTMGITRVSMEVFLVTVRDSR
jgi:hypothetical protein